MLPGAGQALQAQVLLGAALHDLLVVQAYLSLVVAYASPGVAFHAVHVAFRVRVQAAFRVQVQAAFLYHEAFHGAAFLALAAAFLYLVAYLYLAASLCQVAYPYQAV